MGRAAAGGRGALPGAARPGSCAVRPCARPQALPEPAEPPEPRPGGVAGPSEWRSGGEGARRVSAQSASARSQRPGPLPAPLGDRAGAGRPWAGGPRTPACVRSPPSALGDFLVLNTGSRAAVGWGQGSESRCREWGCRGRGALTPAHHLPAPGCSRSPPASPGLYCSGRCCCCSWGQRLPRIQRSPTATRWGRGDRGATGLGWAGLGRDTETRILG